MKATVANSAARRYGQRPDVEIQTGTPYTDGRVHIYADGFIELEPTDARAFAAILVAAADELDRCDQNGADRTPDSPV